MCTYRYRIRFFVHFVGVIQQEQKFFEFELPNGEILKLICVDEDEISKGKEFILSSGGFQSEEEARLRGAKIKTALLVSGAVLRIGIDAGKDIASARMSTHVKERIFEEHGVKIIDNVHGLSVYSEKDPVQTFSMSAVGLVSPASAVDFLASISALTDLPRELTRKELLCLELYGASHYEKSDRARFLTLVLAIEALLVPAERHERVRELVDSFLEQTKRSDLDSNEKSSITGSLRWLYTDSISNSLRELARKHLGEKEYNGVPAPKFISQCYDARSKLVHNGEVNEEKFKLGALAAQLNVFIADLLRSKVGY